MEQTKRASILHVGIRDYYPAYLKQHLRISNTLFLVIGSLNVLYGIFISLKFPDLWFIPAASIAGLGTGALALAFGGHLLYRYLLITVPAFSVFLGHVALIPAGEPPLVSSMLLQFSFSLFPFLVFNVREKFSLGFMTAFCFLLLFSIRWASGLIEQELDLVALRLSYRQEFTLTASFVIVCASMITLIRNARRTEKDNASIIKEAKLKNEELEEARKQSEVNLEKLEEGRREEEKRSWASQGISQFSTIMRRQDKLQEMYDEIIAGLVKYIDANQGGLFLAEGEGKDVSLKLISCYAYGRKKFVENELKPGQGLVGQTYLEKEYIHLTEIPQNYTRISSGLGEATPTALLLVPLMNNEKVEGVVELAAFKPFEKHVIAFVEQLAEEMAATFGVSKMNALTQELLQDAKQQAEMMQAQEEEMRQNMEELAATQEEMQRKEQEYLRRIAELEEKQPTA